MQHARARPAAHRGLAKLGLFEPVRGLLRYAQNRLRGGVLSLTLEMTKRCNAKCDFCDHWREPRLEEDLDHADVVRRIDPLIVIFCGGEPLLRPNIVSEVAAVARVPGWRYHVLITNGWFLTRELGLELDRVGVHQINVSLNWPDDRQSEERRLRGLFGRIAQTVPALTAAGVEVNLNAIIMRDNLEEIPAIARLACEWGAKCTFTLYSEFCNGNASHQIRPADVPRLAEIVEELIALKRSHHNITGSDFYLRRCIDFCGGEVIPHCPAGKKMIHVSPQGMVKPCADLPPIAHYTRFDARSFGGVTCAVCWMACRGEVQAPVDLQRVREVVGI